jgi:hypothetical protein
MMKNNLLFLTFILFFSLSASIPQFSAWRFVNQNGEDWSTDTSDISFEAELNPGSGDMQTLDDEGVEIVLEDIGNGTISSFIVFNFANFFNPWQPTNLLRIKIWHIDIINAEEITIPCSLISEAPYPFYGWETEGFGEPFAAEPFVMDNFFYPDWRNLNWGNGVTGLTWGLIDGIPSNELIHNVNGICPNVNEIPFFGSTGYFFTYTVQSIYDNPFVYIYINLEALGYYPGQVGCYIEDSGWTFFPETWDYENPQPLEWEWFYLPDDYGIIEIILPFSTSDKSEIDIIVAFSTASDIPLGNHSGLENIIIEITEETVNITWNAVAWATSYKVFSCETPDGIFTEDISGICNGTSWTAPVANDKKFYQVIAFR